MATIINTLEVVLEPPRQASPAADAPAQTSPVQGSPLTPADLTDVAERRARYLARLIAH